MLSSSSAIFTKTLSIPSPVKALISNTSLFTFFLIISYFYKCLTYVRYMINDSTLIDIDKEERGLMARKVFH